MNRVSLFTRVLRRVVSHPFNRNKKFAAALRFLKWQFSSMLNPYPIVYNFTGNSKMIISRGTTGATGNLYCGLLEFSEMGFVLHFLREKDLFVDVGANIGSYTILASGQNRAQAIAMEPIPSTFNAFLENILINRMDQRVVAMNVGVGSKPGTLRFTNSQGAINHVATAEEKDTINVPVITLDDVLEDKDPTLIKIDVEGFETEVCNGAWKTFLKPSVKAIIIELNGLGRRYGYSDLDIDARLKEIGFAPYSYDPFSRALEKAESLGSHNTIYVRDYTFVKGRLTTASEVQVADSWL